MMPTKHAPASVTAAPAHTILRITFVTCVCISRLLECASVSASVTSFYCRVLLFALVAAVCTPAEVIHLKNGRTIWADSVREAGNQVEYDVGDNTYAIPKAIVDHIEAGGTPPPTSSNAATTQVPDIPAPAGASASSPGLEDKIIHDGGVDDEVLKSLEQGNAARAALGYYIAGKHEFARGNFGKSRAYFESALKFDSENPAILSYMAAVLVRTGNPSLALTYAEHAARLAPDSADSLNILGYAQLAADRNRDAIRSWKRSLELRPDASIQQLLARAEREASVEADYSEHETSHFTLRYEGQQTSEALRRDLLAALESDYDDLVRDLGVAPRSSIPVILYTGQAFFDVTQAPSWSGAINDGKLRIPISGISSVTPQVAHVLKHELTHSFINYISAGRCPQWLHEGLAQSEEPKALPDGRRLAQLFQAQREIPLNALEGSFIRFSPQEAALAYDESLAAVQYINDTYGMSDLQRILQRLSQGSSTEAALRAVIHCDYGELQGEVAKYLVGKYGS
jgi:tetratricopeptide (TPR) repeat protein